MSNQQPPVPPAGRSPKGPGASGAADTPSDTATPSGPERNVEKQGRQGNVKVNTTHQGHQQDR
jgi:hypothetical protein